mmetsp:Transcript_9348/g.16148  ORF Transcript_9348/g.16148 Transcript_9348/m.16148 type:complete len:239 (+) Transcript_9348:94-810(+)
MLSRTFSGGMVVLSTSALTNAMRWISLIFSLPLWIDSWEASSSELLWWALLLLSLLTSASGTAEETTGAGRGDIIGEAAAWGTGVADWGVINGVDWAECPRPPRFKPLRFCGGLRRLFWFERSPREFEGGAPLLRDRGRPPPNAPALLPAALKLLGALKLSFKPPPDNAKPPNCWDRPPMPPWFMFKSEPMDGAEWRPKEGCGNGGCCCDSNCWGGCWCCPWDKPRSPYGPICCCCWW